MRTDADVMNLFVPLWSDIVEAEEYPAQRPLLAHYTNVVAFEGIFGKDEFWLSNPLFMNDHEEMRFGMVEGNQLMLNSQLIKEACETPERYQEFMGYYAEQFDAHANDLTLDTYVGCFSLHNSEEDKDGRLSMWRGYGAEGNGVAIVLDTSRLTAIEDSPVILSCVKYGTTEERRSWIEKLVSQFALIFQASNIQGAEMRQAASAFLQRLKLFALFTKHKGFEDEREWRIVYFRERDTENTFTDRLSYFLGPQGVEPKLKLKRLPDAGVESFAPLVHSIITGPTVSSPIAVASLKRMLSALGKPELATLVRPSETPLRGKR